MFEGVLYFALGFLAAALIALMISPAIWNRAVVLTKRRIESSVPLTLNEVQADKDQLRAEFAMSTRRLELSIEELQEKAARQVIEINRKRDDLAKLAEESRDKIRMVEELETRSADLRAKLSRREELLEKTSRDLEATREKLDERGLELETLQRQLAEVRADADTRRVELVARQTSLDDASDQLGRIEQERNAARREADELRKQAARLESELRTANDRLKDTETRLERAGRMNSELEDKVQREERATSRKRAADQNDADSANELTRLLMEERKRADKLEADLAKATLRMEAILSDASNENVTKAMDLLNREKTSLRDQLKSAIAERDALNQRLSELSMSSGTQWEDERKENAVLRERINDLAARVTAMTAAMEGPDSPINEIIEKATAADAPDSEGTLADRIRALQDKARLKQAN